MNTQALEFNFYAVKLVSSALGAALEKLGEIPDEYLAITKSMVNFLLAANDTAIWTYQATVNEHAFIQVGLCTLRAVLLEKTRDDADRAHMIDDIDLILNAVKLRGSKLLHRSIN